MPSGEPVCSFSVVLERETRTTTFSVRMCFSMNLARQNYFMASGWSLKMRNTELPTWYRSASDCCFCLLKLILFDGGVLPTREQAKSAAAPQVATKRVEHWNSVSEWSWKARGRVGYGSIVNSYYSSSSALYQSILT